MAIETEITDWILDHKRELGIEICSYSWIQEWLPSFYHYRTSMKIDGIEVFGGGIDDREEVALIKSVAECIERYFVIENGVSSTNGVAAHFDQQHACQIAEDECIERDAFLTYFYSDTKPQDLSQDGVLRQFPSLRPAIEDLKSKKIKVLFKKLKTILGTDCFVTVVDGSEYSNFFGYLFGASTVRSNGNHHFNPLLKSALEILPDAFRLSRDRHVRKAKSELSRQEQHFDLCFDKKYYEKISDWLCRGRTSNSDYKENSIGFTHSQLTSKIDVFKSMPLKVFRAQSSGLQKFFWGNEIKKNIDFGRLAKFTGETLDLVKIKNIPHPFS